MSVNLRHAWPVTWTSHVIEMWGSVANELLTGYGSKLLLSAGDRSDDVEGLFPCGHRFRKRRIGRLMGEVLFAGEEADERTPLFCHMIADRAFQCGKSFFKRLQHGGLGDWP